MKFSIITPSFRQLSLLRLCIASVRDQTTATVCVEHIIQDGGSEGIELLANEVATGLGGGSASAGAVTARYLASVVSEPDEGMYDAINRGLRRADGEICAWLNSDEQYLPGALERVERFFSDHPEAQMVVGDTVLLNESLEPRSYRVGVPPSRKYLQAFQLNMHSSSLFFRRAVLEEGGWLGNRFRSIGDSEWIGRLLDRGIKIHRLPHPVSAFMLGESNLSVAPLSEREKLEWKSELRLSRAERLIVWAGYTLRRVSCGACMPRHLAVSVYTSSSPQCRHDFPASWLDFRFRT